MRKKLTHQEFVERARHVHGTWYDYSQANYEGMYTPVTIICPKHGAFEQRPNNHIYQGSGCQMCGLERQQMAWEQATKAGTREARLRRARFDRMVDRIVHMATDDAARLGRTPREVMTAVITILREKGEISK